MMNAVRLARHGVLKPYLKPEHRGVGSINSPMQCMMKEICAQCLQLHKDPVTGKETVVFSCFNQDQELDHVDFASLRQRLRQNGVQEKIGALWIDRSLRQLGVRELDEDLPRDEHQQRDRRDEDGRGASAAMPADAAGVDVRACWTAR